MSTEYKIEDHCNFVLDFDFQSLEVKSIDKVVGVSRPAFQHSASLARVSAVEADQNQQNNSK